QLQCLVSAQLHANQISLIAAKPQQEHYLVIDGLRAGLLRQAVRLVPLNDSRGDLHYQLLPEEFCNVPQSIFGVRRRPVLGGIILNELICGELDGLSSLLAGLFFDDLAVALLQPLALVALLLDRLRLVGSTSG